LAPPPRTVPRGLQLRLYSHRDILWCWALLIPAAALVFLIPAGASDTRRAVMAIGAAVLWLLALKLAVHPLLRAREAIGLMRDGNLTTGRVVASRFVWDKKKRELPHAQMLSGWQSEISRSQMRKAWGFASVFFLPVLVIPVLFVLGMSAALVMRMLGFETMTDDLVGPAFAMVVSTIVLLVVCGVVWWLFGRLLVGKFGSPEPPAERDAWTGPATILPPDGAIELACRVSYDAGGDKLAAEGRVFLSDRLNRAGNEPLLYDRLEPGKVLLLAGLPPDVETDAVGRWADSTKGGVALGVVAILAAAVLAGILLQAPAVIAATR
jgi:hypothetical protein